MEKTVRGRNSPFDEVVINGGWPARDEVTLARKYLGWLSPSARVMVTKIVDSGYNTVDDLVALVKELRKKYRRGEELELYFISSRSHFERVRWTIEKLGCKPKFVDSSETERTNALVVWGLTLLNRFDPLWTSPVGKFFRWYTGKRAKRYQRNTPC
jgi:hypothetical protein